MIGMPREASHELSTPSPRACRTTDNRRMSDAGTAGGLARFLTIADTAELLSISTSQAYALVRSGELPAIRVGAHGQWRVERQVLESYIEALYEQTRRHTMWNQAEYDSIAEITFGDRGPR